MTNHIAPSDMYTECPEEGKERESRPTDIVTSWVLH